MWSGSLSFGLVNIPIKVYAASEEHAIQFRMLHKKDLSPIQFVRLCQSEKKEVPYSEIVKGYEYKKGEYIVIDEDELKKVNLERTSTIEIQQFANLSEIEIISYEKPYYLEPEKKAGKAYRLLNEALNKSKKVAIVNYVFHNREHLGAIISSNNVLMLIQMRYQAEIRSTDELTLPNEEITSKELQMALDLVNQLTIPFDPEKYHDTYSEEVMELIEKKMKGIKLPKKAKEHLRPSEAQDLMELLKASMKSAPKNSPKSKEQSKKPSKDKIHPLYPNTKAKVTKKAQ